MSAYLDPTRPPSRMRESLRLVMSSLLRGAVWMPSTGALHSGENAFFSLPTLQVLLLRSFCLITYPSANFKERRKLNVPE